MSVPVADVPLHYLSLSDVCRRLKSGEFSAVAVTEAMLARIERLDPELKAYVTVTGEQALAQAAALDTRRANGEPLGPLHGVPIALKDLLWTGDVVTTCGTRVLADWLPPEDATVVTRLKAAGAVILGKVKLTEGAFSNHHPDVAPPVNPWAAERWTGVSSSGSGVSVAAGLAFGALGSDTGGSIRFPSACCGLVGIKPTYGRVSRHGAFPLAESLDHIGPMTRTVEDAARMLGVMAGQDPKDPTSLPAAVPNYVAETGGGLAGFAVGVDRDYIGAGVAPEAVGAVEDALDVLQVAGARIVDIHMPDCADLVEGWAITCGVECVLAHEATWPSRQEDYGPDLARLLALGPGRRRDGLRAPRTGAGALPRGAGHHALGGAGHRGALHDHTASLDGLRHPRAGGGHGALHPVHGAFRLFGPPDHHAAGRPRRRGRAAGLPVDRTPPRRGRAGPHGERVRSGGGVRRASGNRLRHTGRSPTG